MVLAGVGVLVCNIGCGHASARPSRSHSYVLIFALVPVPGQGCCGWVHLGEASCPTELSLIGCDTDSPKQSGVVYGQSVSAPTHAHKELCSVHLDLPLAAWAFSARAFMTLQAEALCNCNSVIQSEWRVETHPHGCQD